ncbi:MAG: OsmC family protein [Spirochaetales bacterium]|nr:OsmC family protein [Spirochaetales bacterium]
MDKYLFLREVNKMEQNLLKASAVLLNQKAKFRCSVNGKPPIISDYTPPHGDGEGYTSLELMLLSLASCFASTVKFILTGPMKKTVSAINATAKGERRREHPTCFEKIELFLDINADCLRAEELENVINAAEESICPVYAMLRGNVEIVVKYKIKEKV